MGPLTEEETQWFVKAIEEMDDPPEESDIEPEIVDFQWNVDKGYINFYSDESGDVEQVCDLVHRFFKEHRPQDRFTIRWAYTCSKPRAGGFGGGIACVTAYDIRFFDDSVWEDATFKEMDIDEALPNG